MKLFSRLVVSGLALALAFSLLVSPAQAASKKKKTYSSEESSSSSKHVVRGTNLQGRSGFFYGDTSDVAPVGMVEGAIDLDYQSGGSLAGTTQVFAGPTTVSNSGYSTNYLGFPAGLHFGIDKDLEISVAEGGVLGFTSDDTNITSNGGGSVTTVIKGGSSTQFSGVVGVKYHIAAEDRHSPEFSIGGSVLTNISPSFGNVFVITPEGTISYTLPSNGMLLNGDMGVAIQTQGGPAYVKLDLGAAYPISNKFSAIAELGANQAGYLGSVFALGARYDLGQNLVGQAFLGAPLNGGNVLIGVGLVLASQ